MKIRSAVLLAVFAPLSMLPLAGCIRLMGSPPASPRPTAWQIFTNGQGHPNAIHVQVSPVRPPRWRYMIESLSPVAISNSPPPGWSGAGAYPPWHAPGIALANVAIAAPGCTVMEVSTNWQVVPGSTFAFVQNSGATELRFTLEGDKANGPVEIRVTDAAGAATVVRNLDGPR